MIGKRYSCNPCTIYTLCVNSIICIFGRIKCTREEIRTLFFVSRKYERAICTFVLFADIVRRRCLHCTPLIRPVRACTVADNAAPDKHYRAERNYCNSLKLICLFCLGLCLFHFFTSEIFLFFAL